MQITRVLGAAGAAQPTSPILSRLAANPVVVAYAPTVVLNASLGSVQRIIATGGLVVSDISNGVDGQELELLVYASGADRTLTIGGSAEIIPSGTWWTGELRYNATTNSWLLGGGGFGGGSGGGGTDVLNAVTDFGAVGDGVTNNNIALDNAVAAALAQNRALYVPAGRYLRTTTWDLRGYSLHVYGDGPEQTVILEGMGDNPTMLFGSYNQWIHDLGTELASTKGANSNAVELHDAAYSTYERITLLGAGRGIYQPQVPADGFGNTVWSCKFDTWRIIGYATNAIWLSGYQGGNTGSVFSNIHISNNLAGGSGVASTGNAVYIAESDEMVFNQLNVEAGILPGNVVAFNRCFNPVINGAHFEGLRINGSDAAFIYCNDNVNLAVNGMAVKFCNLPTAAGDKTFLTAEGDNCDIRIHGVHTDNNTLSATNRYFVRFTAFTNNATVHATGVSTADFTAISTGDTGAIPFLKQINTTWNHRTDGGKNVTWGTAAPASGTWAVGDVRWNTAPTAGGTPGWMCTTAGTPGTWRTMANLA